MKKLLFVIITLVVISSCNNKRSEVEVKVSDKESDIVKLINIPKGEVFYQFIQSESKAIRQIITKDTINEVYKIYYWEERRDNILNLKYIIK